MSAKRRHDSRLLNLGSQILGRMLQVAVLEGTCPRRVAELIEQLRPSFPPGELVRIGGPADGGYLVPRDIDSYELLISPGVGHSYEFDRYFSTRGVPAVLIDGSVEVRPEPNILHLKKFVDAYTSEPDGLISLADLLERYGEGKSRVILQVDIEGAEHRVLGATPDAVLARFGVIAMEAHHLGGLCYRDMFPVLETTFRRLLKNHFVAHLHANNSGRVIPYCGMAIPETMEITFLHRDFYRPVIDAGFSSPHPLDAPSVPTLPEAAVPRCWW